MCVSDMSPMVANDLDATFHKPGALNIFFVEFASIFFVQVFCRCL